MKKEWGRGRTILVYIIIFLVFFGILKLVQYITESGSLARAVNTVQIESIQTKFDTFLHKYASAGEAMVSQYGYTSNGPIVGPAILVAINADVTPTPTPKSRAIDMKAIIVACKDGDKLPDGTLFSYSAGKEPPSQLFRIDPLYLSLPADLVAEEPEEVNVVIKVIWYEYVAAEYSDGGAYFRHCARVMVVDFDSNAVLGVTDVRSDDHARGTKYKTGDLHSSYPEKQICEYIEFLATGVK